MKRGELRVDEYLSIFVEKFRYESNEDVVLFLLNKINWLVRLGLIEKSLMKKSANIANNQGSTYLADISAILNDKIFK